MLEEMRVVRIEGAGGGPETLAMDERRRPEPGPGEVRVRVAASGVNRADVLQRLGRYPAPPGVPPDVPGLEYAGLIEAVGPGLSPSEVGRRVMGIVGGGGYAEALVVPAAEVVTVPGGMELADAAAVPEAFMTAFDALVLQAGLRTGEWLLIHAVGSGVGTAALQLARRVGAHLVGTSRSPGKLERAASVAPLVAVEATEGWPERVREATGGHGIDVLLDLVGASYLPGNQRVLASGARHVVVGIPGGARGEIDLSSLMRKRVEMRGTVLRSRSGEERAALVRAFQRDVLPGFVDGSLRPVVDGRLPAEQAAEAHRVIEENRNFGKLVLVW